MPVERRGPAVRNSFTDRGGGGEMIKAPVDPRTWGGGIYAVAKADPGGSGGVGGGGGAAAQSAAAAVGRISLGAKRAGERSAGKPPAPFDVAGAGDVARGAGLRPTAKAVDKPPDPTVRAPALDPTLARIAHLAPFETSEGFELGCGASRRSFFCWPPCLVAPSAHFPSWD